MEESKEESMKEFEEEPNEKSMSKEKGIRSLNLSNIERKEKPPT